MVEVTEVKLNPKQELFCQLYASDKEFFGNGLQSYMEAYDVEPAKWKSALASASRLLTNVSVLKRVNELLELNGLNAPYVDKQLEFLVTQHADFKTKLGAIKEFNQLNGRIKQKLDVTSGDKPIETGIDVKDLALKMAEELKKAKT